MAKTAVLDALHMQEAFWHDRARVKWLTEGDRNTIFSMLMLEVGILSPGL